MDILINNAELTIEGNFYYLEREKKLEILNVNLNSMLNLSNLIMQDMIYKKRGKIFNITPLKSFLPSPGEAIYGACKSFVHSFSESMAEELKDFGIQVSVLCYGPMDSESNFLKTAFKRARTEN